jgi:GxxExxY protein
MTSLHRNVVRVDTATDERDPQTFAIIGAAMEVHRVLGTGFLEAVYKEALRLEMMSRGIPHAYEVRFPITYKDQSLTTGYRVDFVCYSEVVVELKALRGLSGIEEAQVINYLKASGLRRSLLLNFGSGRLEYRRLVLSQSG